MPTLPAEVLQLSKAQRRAWRIKYLQDLYIPDGLSAEQETTWRRSNTVQALTGSQNKSTGIPLRSVPNGPRSDSNAQSRSILQPQPSQASDNEEDSTSQVKPPKPSEPQEMKLSRTARRRIKDAQRTSSPQPQPPNASSAQEPSISQAISPELDEPQASGISKASLRRSRNAQKTSSLPAISPIANNALATTISQADTPKASNAPSASISQATPPKSSKAEKKAKVSKSSLRRAKSAQKVSNAPSLPVQPFGFTRLCIAPKKQWHNADGSVWQPSEPPSAVEQAINKSSTSNHQPQDTFAQPPAKRQKTGHVIFPSSTERRLSSIPTNLGSSNGAETFRRMAAIVDHSDSEQSESSSDDEVIARPVVRGSMAESFADRINEGSPKSVKASPNSQLQSTLEEAIENEEMSTSNQAESPSKASKISDDILETELVNSATLQQSPDADTPMQDVISLSSDAESGAEAEILSLPGHAIDGEQIAKPFNINAEESTQEVYEAVEEVLEDVCSSTRALPSSTSTSPQPRKDPLITNSSSRHSELVLESMTKQQDPTVMRDGDSETSGDDSMAEVGEEAGEQDMDGISTGSTSDAGSNIVVASRKTSADQSGDEDVEMKDIQPAHKPSLKSKSSSSILEELSRTPSPPPPAISSQVDTTTRRLSQRNRGSQVEVSEALPASPRVIVTRVSDAKRKLTGVTSKHFSKVKPNETPRQSQRVAAKSASQANSQEPPQTIPRASLPWTHADDDSGEDEIQVAPRRQTPRKATPAKGLQKTTGKEDVQKSASRSTLLEPWTATSSKQRIAYVDLTGGTSRSSIEPSTKSSTKAIAYVDLTGQTSDVQDAVPSGSPPNDNDEPLDHLAKLLKSPHFSEEKPIQAERPTAKSTRSSKPDGPPAGTPTTPITPKRTLKTPKKTTGTKSPHFITDRVDLYNTTSSSRRVAAGTSTVPVPPLSSSTFGIIQEKLWKEPFWLLIAVTFLNKTTGRAAVPIFWKVKKLFPTPEELAKADPDVLLEMVKSLGLQNARSKRLISMAQAWVENPPLKGKAFRTLNYPSQGDGRAREVPDVVEEEDIEICKGSLEIGQIPGCGAYAYDSWRVFCRDVLRGVAEDYDGKGAVENEEDGTAFEPEWKRVVPGDKELRACLRWMWMREGWVWDPVTGEKRRASEAELEMAGNGEMMIEDEGERKFAKRAVGVDVSSPVKGGDGGDVPY